MLVFWKKQHVSKIVGLENRSFSFRVMAAILMASQPTPPNVPPPEIRPY